MWNSKLLTSVTSCCKCLKEHQASRISFPCLRTVIGLCHTSVLLHRLKYTHTIVLKVSIALLLLRPQYLGCGFKFHQHQTPQGIWLTSHIELRARNVSLAECRSVCLNVLQNHSFDLRYTWLVCCWRPADMQRHIWEIFSRATLYILIKWMKNTKRALFSSGHRAAGFDSTQWVRHTRRGDERQTVREINESQKSNLTCRALKRENQIVKTEFL